MQNHSTTGRTCLDCAAALDNSHPNRRRCIPCSDANRRKIAREWARKARTRPDVKAYEREYQREYQQRPEAQARRREWQREYSRQPAVKERRRLYNQRPEVQDRNRKRDRDRYPERADAMREYKRCWVVEYSQRPEVRKRRAERQRLRKPWDGSVTAESVAAILEAQGGRCAACRSDIRSGYHMDHIMPMARGGESTLANLQLLCPRCNSKKGAKDPHAFAKEHGRLF